MSKRSWQETDFDAQDSATPSTKRQKTSNPIEHNEMDLLDLVDDAEEIEALDCNSLRLLMKSLHECILKNQQQRSKFSDTAIKFKESEIALNDVIQELSLKLPESPDLYRDFVLMKGVDHLLNLLMHENIDIVSTIIGFIKELTEADNYIESDTAILFIVQFIQQNGVKILLQNLKRLHDANLRQNTDQNEAEDDSQTIFAMLSILENISEIEMDFCIAIVKQCKLFKILLNMMRKKQELGKTFDEIQLYLSELLCIYLQPMDDEDVFIYKRFAEIKGCDKILDLVKSKYSNQDPIVSEEKEYVSNVLDALSSALASTVNQDKFYESPSAMNVLLGLIKQGHFVKQGCIQALMFAITDHKGNCVQLVQKQGLKTIFGQFMNRKNIKKKYRKHHDKDKTEEYLCCILVHLFSNLSDLNLLRLMKKFKEKEYAKVERLVELHSKYWTRLEEHKKQKTINEKETFEEGYAERLDHGLYTLQMVDIVIAFAYTFPDEEDNAVMKQRIVQVLNQCDMDIE
eukprot:106843_1